MTLDPQEEKDTNCIGCLWTPMILYSSCAIYFHYQKKNIGHWPSLILSTTCLLLAGHYLSKNIIHKHKDE